MTCSPNLARVCGLYFDQGLVFIIDVGEIGCHGNRPWILSQIDKPRSNPELERQSFGGQGKKDLGVLMSKSTQNIQIQQFCCVILMFSLPFLLTSSCDGVMAGFQKRWHFCPLSHLPGVCPFLLMLCFHTVLAWGAHMKYLVWETSICLCFVPSISVKGLTKGLVPSRISPLSFCSLYFCGMMSR